MQTKIKMHQWIHSCFIWLFCVKNSPYKEERRIGRGDLQDKKLLVSTDSIAASQQPVTNDVLLGSKHEMNCSLHEHVPKFTMKCSPKMHRSSEAQHKIFPRISLLTNVHMTWRLHVTLLHSLGDNHRFAILRSQPSMAPTQINFVACSWDEGDLRVHQVGQIFQHLARGGHI